MPVYEYVCNNCNDRFDRLVRSLEASGGVMCIRCESGDVRRLVSGFAVMGASSQTVQPSAPRSGGCCGGSCGCGGHA